jgi:hypothetical protein
MQRYDNEKKHCCGKNERPHDGIFKRHEVVLATILE